MAHAFSDANPAHLLIRALGEDRAARHAVDEAGRRAHEELARRYRERAAQLGAAVRRRR